jgi:hypothetical protein
MSQIGHQNLSLIKNLNLYIRTPFHSSKWIELNNILAEKATGLRFIRLTFQPNRTCEGFPRGELYGGSVDFIRTFARIEGLNGVAMVAMVDFSGRNGRDMWNGRTG